MKVSILHLQILVFLFNVYGLIKIEEKKEVWNKILESMNGMGKVTFILGREFNKTLDMDDKKGSKGTMSRIQFNF